MERSVEIYLQHDFDDIQLCEDLEAYVKFYAFNTGPQGHPFQALSSLAMAKEYNDRDCDMIIA